MTNKEEPMDENNHSPERKLVDKIESDAEKKLQAKKRGSEIIFGFGTFGMIGWSIAVPALIGAALGMYLDNKFNPGFSWTLTLIFSGVIIGCINAWRWIKKKSLEN
ncbi:AtpZ/AtpI family protein [Anaerobium acetethylicum]|nr:AtpZ/AtpI family protein [Anaerobium acetethylicum]